MSDRERCEAAAKRIFGIFGYPVNNAPLSFAAVVAAIAEERADAAAKERAKTLEEAVAKATAIAQHHQRRPSMCLECDEAEGAFIAADEVADELRAMKGTP